MFSSLLSTFVLLLSIQVYAQLDNSTTQVASSVQPPALATESCIVLFSASGTVPAFTVTSEFARPTHHERNGTLFNVTSFSERPFPTGVTHNRTHTLFATVVTSSGVASTVFASASLQAVPSGLPICPDVPFFGNHTFGNHTFGNHTFGNHTFGNHTFGNYTFSNNTSSNSTNSTLSGNLSEVPSSGMKITRDLAGAMFGAAAGIALAVM